MTAYGAVNGVPMSASRFLVDTIARKTYGMEGYVTGDCGAIDDIVRGHHFTDSYEVAASLGIKAGVDTDCGGVYQSSALKAVQQGILTEGEIDKALVNLFTIRMSLSSSSASFSISLITKSSMNVLATSAVARQVPKFNAFCFLFMNS